MLPGGPDFFLVGTPKAGTTSIYKYFAQNPEIFVPIDKEPNYYTDVGPNFRHGVHVKSEAKYLKLFSTAKQGQIKGDFSVSYMHDHLAWKKIYDDNPAAKIIMIIRHPVNRAYSHWLMDKREGFTNGDFFDEFLKDINYKGTRGFCYNSMYYDCGLYAEDIEKYRSLFADVLVLVYEDIFVDLQKTLSDIYKFLNVKPVAEISTSKYNESGVVKNRFYRSIYSNWRVRRLLKFIVPEKLKEVLRAKIMEKSESKVSEQDFKRVAEYFKDDVIKVRQLLNKPGLWSNL